MQLYKFNNAFEIHYGISYTFAYLLSDHIILVGQKTKNTPINSNTNYRREMKLIPINMDYCLLQNIALKIF